MNKPKFQKIICAFTIIQIMWAKALAIWIMNTMFNIVFILPKLSLTWFEFIQCQTKANKKVGIEKVRLMTPELREDWYLENDLSHQGVNFPSFDSYQDNICCVIQTSWQCYVKNTCCLSKTILFKRFASNSYWQACVNPVSRTLYHGRNVSHYYIMMELINNIACFPIFAMALWWPAG